MRSSWLRRLTIAKYSRRGYGSFKMWKSLLLSPTQPKQYVQPESPALRTRYELDTQFSQSTECWHPIMPLQPRQCDESVQA